MTQNDLKGFRFRESTRAPFETEVKLRFDRFGGAVSGFSADISMEGMFVRTAEPKPVGTLVQFEFGLGADGELIQGLGDVVWVRTRQLAPNKPPGMGIQFRYIDPHSRELIFKIVDKFLKETKQEGAPPPPAEPTPPAPAASPPPAAAPAPTPVPPSLPGAPALSAPSAAPLPVAPGQGPGAVPLSPPVSPSVESAASSATAAAGPPAPAAPRPSPPAPQAPAAPGPSLPQAEEEAFTFAIPALDSEEDEPRPYSPPLPVKPPPRRGGGGELFVPDDEMWDPVSAAAQAVTSEPILSPPARPSYAGGAGVARQSSGSRRLLLVALLLLVAAAVGVYLFRDRLSGLLPGRGEAAQEVNAAPGFEQSSESGVEDALPPAAESGEDIVAADTGAGTPEVPREEEPGTGLADASASPAAEPREVSPMAGEPLTRVEEIRSWQRAGETLVTIEGNGSFREGDYGELRLENPPRLLVKLYGIEEDYLAVTPVSSPELRQIRTALHSGNELHVVLDLASGDVRSAVTLEEGRLRIRLER